MFPTNNYTIRLLLDKTGHPLNIVTVYGENEVAVRVGVNFQHLLSAKPTALAAPERSNLWMFFACPGALRERTSMEVALADNTYMKLRTASAINIMTGDEPTPLTHCC